MPTASCAGSPFISDEVQNKPLAELGLSPRVLNALRSRQIDKVGQVLTMDPDQLLSIRNFGPRSLNELREKLAEFGYLPEGEVGVFGAGEGYLDALESAMGDEDDGSDTDDVERGDRRRCSVMTSGDLAASFGVRPTAENEDEEL